MTPISTPILLVEDNEDDVLLIERAARLAQVAYPLQVARDGEAALDYLTGAGDYADRALFPAPRLVLLDLKLPKKSGFEVLTWVRAHPTMKPLPVVVLTSSGQSADVARAYDLGANSYLVKPVAFDELRALMHTLDAYWFHHATLPDID